MARINPDFKKRNVKIIGLSVDPLDKHKGWAKDIEETQGYAPNFPMIADPELEDRQALRHASGERGRRATADGRTPADNQTVRNVYVIGPDKKIKLFVISYPMTTGRNFDEVLRVINSLPADGKAQGGDAGELEAGRRRDHRRLGDQRRRQNLWPGGWKEPKPYIRIVPQPKA